MGAVVPATHFLCYLGSKALAARPGVISAVLTRFGQNALFYLLTNNLILFALKTIWPGEELHAKEYVPLMAVVSAVIYYYLLAIVYKHPRRTAPGTSYRRRGEWWAEMEEVFHTD